MTDAEWGFVLFCTAFCWFVAIDTALSQHKQPPSY
jgi:hypothetical protein